MDKATTEMFCRASDFESLDAGEVNLLLTTVIYVSVRNAFERGLGPEGISGLKSGLKTMCHAYLVTVGK